jgi:PAS domain S-box-containing protein
VSDAREHHSRFFDLSLDMLCTAGFDGYFKDLNPAWERVIGFTLQELRAQPYIDLVHPDDRAATLTEARKLAHGAETIAFENRYRCKDGSYRWLLWSAGVSPADQLIFAVAKDITNRKRSESERASVSDRAIEASRLKSEFLSRMSHELRTPLNAILGFAQLLELDDLADDQRESVEQILRGGRHLLALINEVLDISKIETGRLALSIEAVSVTDVIQETLQLIRPLAEARAIVVVTPPSTFALNVMADHQRLKQVLLNLASNAIKYNRPGGTVTFSCHRTSDGRIRIGVHDTGAGISPDNLERIFTPFDRLGAEHTGEEGTGIGLSLSKGLVEAMGGTLTVESTFGEGSAFLFELDTADDPLARYEVIAESTAQPDEAQAGTVLYVEDNPANLRLVERIVAQRGDIRLLSARGGREGLDLALQYRPDLVLLDLHLPDMNGAEVLQRLQADPATAEVPVVMVSADATPGQIERLHAAGAHDYLTKPFDLARLVEVLDSWFERAEHTH